MKVLFLNDSAKTIITLVGSKQARIGFTFIHEGPAKVCIKCSYNTVCVNNLKRGWIYKVVSLRDKHLPCEIHEENARVVEVQQAEIKSVIESRLAIPSGIISFNPQHCENEVCPNFSLCVPMFLKKGDKCKIADVKNSIDCPLSRPLVFALLLKV
jgi:uncharacterized protein (UPF0179 family)